jgi:hypothetical protein
LSHTGVKFARTHTRVAKDVFVLSRARLATRPSDIMAIHHDEVVSSQGQLDISRYRCRNAIQVGLDPRHHPEWINT